ncbi:MAG: F0F1 ATP synthase subunit gamma, partial [Bacilli bacterium]|nr:F0F1 ATP synthase subunit gamma [Bacilli bacterium]
MRIKNVVKVMNFHSLLRVDSAKKKAEKYFEIEKELNNMISSILYNRNFILDQKTLKPNPHKPELDIYIGNDYGFCGNFNQEINNNMEKFKANFKIVIGKKMKNITEKLLLRITKEEFHKDWYKIERIILKGIKNMSYSKINVIYNHYNSINSFTFTRKTLFPISSEESSGKSHKEDFIVETDINDLFVNLITLY